MPFSTACPNCDARLQVPEALAGKRVKCKKCDEAFVARPPADEDDERRPTKAKTAVPRPTARPVDDDEPRPSAKRSRNDDDDREDDDRPARRSRRDEDEYDRPRRKAGGKRKKAKSGSNLGTILILMIAGFVALCVGLPLGVWYAYLREPDLGTTQVQNSGPGGQVRGPGGPGGFIGPAGPEPVNVAGWVEQRDPDGRYRAKFPNSPERRVRPGGVESVQYQSRSGGDTFTSLCRPLTADEQRLPPEQMLEQVMNVVGAAGGEVQRQTTNVTYQGLAGRQAILTSNTKGGGIVLRILHAGDRAIVQMVITQFPTPDAAAVKAFFDSLVIE